MLGNCVVELYEQSDGQLARKVEEALLDIISAGREADKLDADAFQAREELCAMEVAVGKARHELITKEIKAGLARREIVNQMTELNLRMTTRFARLRVSCTINLSFVVCLIIILMCRLH